MGLRAISTAEREEPRTWTTRGLSDTGRTEGSSGTDWLELSGMGVLPNLTEQGATGLSCVRQALPST